MQPATPRDQAVQREMARSLETIYEVWPQVSPLLGDARLHSHEGDSNRVARELDMYCGIDAILEIKGIRYTAAFRVHRNNDFRTATTGVYEKAARTQALRHPGSAFPYFTIQIYATEQHELRYVVIMKTEHLINHLNTCGEQCHPTDSQYRVYWDRREGQCYMERHGKKNFIVSPVGHLIRCGVPVDVSKEFANNQLALSL